MAMAIDKSATAVLLMDFQNGIVGVAPEKDRPQLMSNAAAVLAAARKNKLPVFHVVVRFKEGHPEVSERNKSFSMLKKAGRLVEGTEAAEIDARVAPVSGETVVTKLRVGAFSTTGLETLLRARGVNSLVLMGIATSGVVLSTVRWAADMDYGLTVVADACADGNAEVHRVLTENVFPAQANVVTTKAFLESLAG
jgi:nicotinamidase-related amidase